MSGPMLSVVVPVLNEGATIQTTLQTLQPWSAAGHEVIVVDGGSADDTVALARPLATAVLNAPKGRARQMNAGAAHAQGTVLLFLHADTRLPPGALESVQSAVVSGAVWGRFDVRISGRAGMLRVVSTLMNWRSRWTGIATGDQAIFVRRDVFEQAGGYPDQPLMEDIELSARLRRLARPACLRGPAVTSGRRWDSNGVWRTIFLMWRLRWRYWRGESPEQLVEAYR